MSDHTVTVWGKKCAVTVDRMSKTVYRASGEYMGEQLQAKGQTAGAALKAWADAARYRGNDGPPP